MEIYVCHVKTAAFGVRGGKKRGGFSKILKFDINIEIYVEKSKESSGAIRFSIFSILSQL